MSEKNPLGELDASTGLSRRELLKRAGIGGAAGLSLPALLAACGSDEGDGGGGGDGGTNEAQGGGP